MANLLAVLLKEVESVSAASRVTVSEVKPLPVQSTETATHYALDMKLECTPEEWVDFVYNLETSPSLFDVQRASIGRKPEAPDRFEGSLRVMTTVLQPAAVLATAPPKKPNAKP